MTSISSTIHHTPRAAWLLLSVICVYIGSFCPMLAAEVGVHTFASQSLLAEGRWVKIALNGTDDGIYQISYSQLRQMGFSNPSTVGVYGYGGYTLPESFAQDHYDDLPEVAVCNDQQKQRILFYAHGTVAWEYSENDGYFKHRQHPYSTQAFYFLHDKGEASRALAEMPSLPAEEAVVTVTTYDEHLLHEQENTNIGHTGREYYGESFLYNQSQDFKFPPLAAGQVRITANFIACSTSTSTVKFSLDGEQVSTSTLSKRSSTYTFATEANVNRVTTSANSHGSTVRVTFVPGSATPTLANLNYITLQGSNDITLPSTTDSYLLFRNIRSAVASLAYSAASASSISGRLQVWDVTSPIDVCHQLTLDDDRLTFVSSAKGMREYALVNLDGTSFPGIKVVGTVENQNLHALPPTNMIIVTAPAFRQFAQQLADFRTQHDGLHVTVVTDEQIYNEYSSGVPDVTAIRLFAKQFYDRYHLSAEDDSTRRELRYLLLYGDGHYHNRSHASSNYFLPTYQMQQSLVETSSCTCDDYFGFLDDTDGGRLDAQGRYSLSADVLDIGVGRFPVHTLTDAQSVLQKTIAYAQNDYFGSWKNRLLFLSDDDKIQESGSDSPNLHMKHNEQLVNSLLAANHNEFTYHKIYLPAYTQSTTASGTDYPDAKKEFNQLLQQGVLMVNYAGHGSATSITNENMMTAAKAYELNMKYLPVWVTASCDVSRWDDDETSMGEALLLNPNGGAEALFSTVRVVYAQQNLKLNQAIIDNIFDRNADGSRFRLGDILRAAKVTLGVDYNKLNFCLLGDPSCTLSFPEQEMELTAVNGTPLTSEGDNFSLPALSRVTMRGHVYKTGQNEVDTTFNGLVYPTIYDAQETILADKGLYQDPVYEFSARNRKVFTGRGEVRNGEFEFSFVVPQDVSYSAETGLVNLYACSDDGKEGQGFFNRFTIAANETALDADTLGPDIFSLFLNETSFRSGDVVNPTPYFYAQISDSSGINATGNSIGHDISLTIRSLTNPLQATTQYILNNYFTTYTGKPNMGSIGYSLPAMEDGTYQATFRVWDTYNNHTTATFQFVVDGAQAPQNVLVQAYPAPARQGNEVTFRILHNRPAAADVLHLQIYTQTGQLVHEQTASTSASTIVYLRDDAQQVTDLSSALNADETNQFFGQSAIQWKAEVSPGLYIYRVYMQSGGSDAASESKLLLIR